MKQALLVIDVQNGYFAGGRHELYQAETVLEQCLKEINKALNDQQLVLIIQHINTSPLPQFFKPNSLGVENHPQIDALLKNTPDMPLIIKHKRNSFLDTGLSDVLTAHNITALKICGMKTDWCVTCTTQEALRRNFPTTVVASACTTLDIATHTQALAALKAAGATIENEFF